MLILGWINEAFTGVGIWITVGVYKVAAFVFEVFLILASGSLLDASSYEKLLNNFYIVLGIIMLFIVAFSLLKGMVNPDDQKQGTSAIKKMIINIVTSGIIMAVLPTIFTFAYDFQTSFIVEQNTIGKFFGYGSTGGTDSPASQTNLAKVKKGAYQIVNGVYTAFFNVNVDMCADPTDASSGIAGLQTCQKQIFPEDTKVVSGKNIEKFYDTISAVDTYGTFGLYSEYAGAVDDEEIDFNFLLCLIAGFLLIYVGISYCFDMAIRLVKLVFYQLIAPIPIFFRIIPEGKLSGTFNQWTKITLTCYMEVFVRIFVFYFCVYLCTQMIAPGTFLGETVYQDYGIFLGLFAKAFVLMGIVTFMRQAPKLISEITGLDSGNMKLGIRDKLAAGGAFTAGAILGGGATALARNAVNKWGNKENWKDKKSGKITAGSVFKNLGAGVLSSGAGAISGAYRSGKAGWGAKSGKDMGNAATTGSTDAVKAREKRANYKAAHGGTIAGSIGGHIKDFRKSAKNYFFDESIEGLTRESNSMGNLYSKYNTFNDTIENLLEKEQSKGGGSVFLEKNGGFKLNNYDDFAKASKALAEAKSEFNLGKIDATQLEKINGDYIKARDAARDELMNLALKGSKSSDYQNLTTKGQAALKDSLVNAESLQATILENANTKTVQEIMGSVEFGGNGALESIMNGTPLTVDSFTHNGSKLKDAAKVAQGKADIKIAEMNKEKAAKGDKK